MEDQKLFNNQDDFFIAEKLDALMNSIPVPPHTEKEFNDKDKYIIWTKLYAPAGAITKYGQIWGNGIQLNPGDSQPWNGIQTNVGIAIAGTNITVLTSGVYEITWIAEIGNLT